MIVPLPTVLAEAVSSAGEWEERSWFPPGPQLAICLSGGKDRLSGLSDAELVEVAVAARRQTAWAQARELAAIAELRHRRCADEEDGHPDQRVLSAHESVTEEVATALTVTGNAAATLVHLAERLSTDLPGTREALETGRIDLAKVRVICDVSDGLPDGTSERFEVAVLDRASEQTTGQLRRRAKRVVHRLAPEACEERRRRTVENRRLELWETASGTADLALLDLNAEDAHAIYNKITAVAHGLKGDGDDRPLNLIRADLATRLLHGSDLPDAVRVLLAEVEVESSAEVVVSGGEPECTPSPDADLDGATGVQVRAASVGRRLAAVHDRARAAGTLDALPVLIGRAVAEIHDGLADSREAVCRGSGTAHGHPGYRPPVALRREVEARHSTCVFPTCNNPSPRCDLDHTVPWRPGITCACNLAPLCRRHHRTKQTPGWRLTQIWPGLLVWTTPSGTWHITLPDRQ